MIELRRVERIYRLGGNDLLALNAIAGKSTLMNILGCLDSPTSGTYSLDGMTVSGGSESELARVRNRRIGFIFQSFNLMPRTSAVDNVAQPLIYRGMNPTERRRLAIEALQQVGLSDRLRHKPNELSGGQRQRVAIARAIVGRPALLLADEPTGNLDSRTAREIMELFTRLHQQGHTLIIVTHDQGIASCCRRVICLQDGRIVSDHPQVPQ
jgi:putative ABC transport system ATP-binding protein